MKKIDRESIENLVYTYKTKYKEGFIASEQKELLKGFPDINMEKYNDALMGITCIMSENDGLILYHCDILKALLCGIENRNLYLSEFD